MDAEQEDASNSSDSSRVESPFPSGGEVTGEYAQHLFRLGNESSRLDYKDFPQPSDNDKFKVGLVADIVAMSNTDGGCLLIGAKEKKSDSPAITWAAAPDAVVKKEIDADSIQKKLESVCADPPVWHGGWVTTPDGHEAFLAIIDRSRLPQPMLRDGAWGSPPKVEFKKGEVLVRRGAQTTRADLGFIRDWEARVRADEREKARTVEATTKQITDRLDLLIGVVGGAGRELAPEAPSDALGKQVSLLVKAPDDQRREIADRAMDAFIDSIWGIWRRAVIREELKDAKIAAREITKAIKQVSVTLGEKRGGDDSELLVMGFLAPLAYLELAMVSLAIQNEAHTSVWLISPITAGTTGANEHGTLSRRVQTWLSQKNRLKVPSFSQLALDHFGLESSSAILTGPKDSAMDDLTCADFLLCICRVTRDDFQPNYIWPGFAFTYLWRYRTFGENVIANPKLWLGIDSPQKLSDSLWRLSGWIDQRLAGNYFVDGLDRIEAVKRLWHSHPPTP